MAFNLQTWREEFKKRLPGWKKRLGKSGVNSAYFFIAATALLPVIQAAHGGDWSAVAALGGAVGTNLLANLLQEFKDKSDGDVAQALQTEVQAEPELQAELDAVLEKLDALKEAEHALAEDDKRWFLETIREEVKHLHSGAKYEATLIGDGGLAQGNGAVALGKNAKYVAGDYVENKYEVPNPRQAEQEKSEKARIRYLKKLRKFCQSLPLAAMGGEEGADDEITLDYVYIALDTRLTIRKKDLDKIHTSKKIDLKSIQAGEDALPARQMPGREEGQDAIPLPVLEAARLSPRFALLGDPGAGKSTFVRNLLALQAASLLGECQPLEGFDPQLIPLYVILRDLAPRLNTLNLGRLSAERQRQELALALRSHLLDDLSGYGAQEFAGPLGDALDGGQVLLILDGLDEVPHQARLLIRQAVAAFIAEYQPARLILTSRIRSYTGDAVMPFPSFTIAPFDVKKINAFVQGWYNAQVELGRFNKEKAAERAVDLARAATGDDLRELSSNPMMLTSMAIIHQKEIGLPHERVRLYQLVVDVLLNRWQKQKTGAGQVVLSEGLANFLKDDLHLRATLERLAYQAQRTGQGDKEAADLPRGLLLELLEHKEYLDDSGLAAEFLDYVDQRAGLLVGRGGDDHRPIAYSFPHRTFQEYLAGCYLLGQRDLVRTLCEHAGQGDFWDLAILLGIEEQYYNRRNSNLLLDLAYSLCPEQECKTEASQRALLWSGQIACLVGSNAILADALNPNGGENYITRMEPALVRLLKSRLPPVERAEAGRVLAKLGDPRLDVLTVEHIQFCRVPAGEFLMGDDKPKKAKLPEYFISRYPITNAQFACFIAANGYSNARFWEEAVKAKYWKKGQVKSENWDNEPRTVPVDYGEPYNLSNHPRVGISWYEALAFTRWLEEQILGMGGVHIYGEDQLWKPAKGFHVGLPDEAQWEKAARGADGHAYPWGQEFDPNKANTSETGIGTTSAVGCFPGGESPCGALDMSGNVWEWVNGENNLRGGAFDFNLDFARCAYRLRSDPDSRNDYVGFRIVVSPLFLS